MIAFTILMVIVGAVFTGWLVIRLVCKVCKWIMS